MHGCAVWAPSHIARPTQYRLSDRARAKYRWLFRGVICCQGCKKGARLQKAYVTGVLLSTLYAQSLVKTRDENPDGQEGEARKYAVTRTLLDTYILDCGADCAPTGNSNRSSIFACHRCGRRRFMRRAAYR
jgi:hypothetical protein